MPAGRVQAPSLDVQYDLLLLSCNIRGAVMTNHLTLPCAKQLERCQVSGSAGGIIVSGDSQPSIRACIISKCRDFAMKIMGRSQPNFESNIIIDIQGFGIMSCDDGGGVCSRNDLSHLSHAAVVAGGRSTTRL